MVGGIAFELFDWQIRYIDIYLFYGYDPLSSKRRSITARGCRLVRRGRLVAAKARFHNGLGRRGGDKCGSEAVFRWNCLTT